VTPEIMDLLLESVDILKVLLENVREQNGEEVSLDDIIARLIACQMDSAAVAKVVEDDAPHEEKLEPAIEESAPFATTEDSGATESVTEKKIVHKKQAEQTIRVDVNRLDSLMLLMGELVLARNSLVQTVGRINKQEDTGESAEALNGSVASVNYITSELQLAVMKMRMQPVGKVFGKFPRLVRDLSRDSGKQIRLDISGESTELDKSVIEEIGDPLVHLIRNSCDHGIESPEDRATKGKPVQGVVKLSAGQEGSNIIIAIEDDGKGLDVNAIRAKAVERGLATAAEIERMPDKEVFRFIFEAGFSTAKVVSDVSGRGVGMDVVRTNIEKLNGLIELESTVDVGTTITIKLPLTLAILQGLLVESGDDVFILPLSSVYETVKTDQSDVSYVNQKPVLRLRDEIIPVINLGEILKGSSSGFVLSEKPYIVVVGLADRKLGIIIDRFLGQEEVVIKSLGQYLGTTEGIAGATILGDGRIRLIVDLLGLFSIARRLS
jgi:two-component system, chemotaxis family, sensor kinase CheA